MYRTIVGTLIFSLAIFVGIQSTDFITNAAQFSLPTELPEPGSHLEFDRTPKSPDRVRVSYIGINDSELRFLIYNGSTDTLLCQGYSGICASPEVRVNGFDANAWVCMNGSSIYEILPGDMVEMMVSPYDFARVPGKNDKVEIGFKSLDDDAPEQSFAEPITLRPAFRKEIRDYLSN